MFNWNLLLGNSVTVGLIFSAILSALIVASLKINPEMWLNDMPPDVKAAWGPISDKARRQKRLLLVPFFGLMVGAMALAVLRLGQLGAAYQSFLPVFVCITIMFQIFNLVDAVIIDWLLVRIWPKLMMLPGTEGMAGYRDMRFWTVNLVKGIAASFVMGLIVAGITSGALWIGTLA
jgi:hypothetical protein